MKTVGIFADFPMASTGFANVCRNLADELSRHARVIYFGRFGQEKEFSKIPYELDEHFFEYVPCKGGVWDEQLCVRIMNHYDLDYVFTEDDWYSVGGLQKASHFHDIPFHFHVPIDSLPMNKKAKIIFSGCDKIYVPNRSWKDFDGMKRYTIASDNARKRQGDYLKSVYLPHGVDTRIFKNWSVERDERFTFGWIGRVEPRKSPARAIMAFEKIHHKIDAVMYIRSDWRAPTADKLWQYIEKKNLPVILDQMTYVPHVEIAKMWNHVDVNVCTAKAGGFEMSITEAAACGVPSLVTDWTYMADNVIDGKTGFRIPLEGFTNPPSNWPDNKRVWGNVSVDALADKMMWCYLNPGKTRLMGNFAKTHVTKNFNWRTIGKKLWNELTVNG